MSQEVDILELRNAASRAVFLDNGVAQYNPKEAATFQKLRSRTHITASLAKEVLDEHLKSLGNDVDYNKAYAFIFLGGK